MNRLLLEYHKRHFSQAKVTPLMSEPLKDTIGYTSEGPLAQALKKGTSDIDSLDTDEYTKDFLKELQHKESDPPTVSEEFDWKDIRQGFK
eukprot:1113196-Ditylum_brightwellii.AAC.1